MQTYSAKTLHHCINTNALIHLTLLRTNSYLKFINQYPNNPLTNPLNNKQNLI